MGVFSDAASAGHLMLSDTLDLFNTGYSVYQDQRNYKFQNQVFDYQKALQKQIFDREDTAVQRRRKDLEAAGLNPNLAAGSGASAGAIVGTSVGPGDKTISKANLLANYGAYLDAKKAQQEVKQAQYMTDILKQKADAEQVTRDNNQVVDAINQYYDTGADVSDVCLISYPLDNGRQKLKLMSKAQIQNLINNGLEHGWSFNPETKSGLDSYGNPFAFQLLSKTKYWQSLENGWTLEKNDVNASNLENSILTTQEEWQTSDQWFDKIIKSANTLLNGVDTVSGARRSYKRRR